MSFGDYDFTLLANQSTQIAATGNILRVRSSTGKLKISIDGGPGATFSAGQGFKMPPGKAFRDVTVRDLSGAGNTGVIFIGDATYEDSTFNGAVTITGGLPNLQGAFTQSAAAVVAAGMTALAGNAARRYLEVINTDAIAVITMTLDGSTPGATANGIILNPGDSWHSMNYAPTGAVKLKSDVATATATVLEG